MKKLSTILLTAVLLLSSANAFGYITVTKNGVRYKMYQLGGNFLSIVGLDPTYTGNIEIVFGSITYTYNGSSYTRECTGWDSDSISSFANEQRITKVTCSRASLSDIPAGFFQGCKNLTYVDLSAINQGTFDIGNSAFANCTKLSTVKLPQDMFSIGDYAFSNCAMTSMTFNDIYYTISPTAFNNCTQLKTIIWNNTYTLHKYSNTSNYLDANSVTNDMPFYRSLKDVVTTVIVKTSSTSCIFYGMTKLTSLTFDSSVKSVGENAFGGCTALTTWSGGENIHTFRKKAFAGCTNLAKPISMTNGYSSGTSQYYTIEDYAFYNTKVPSLTVGTVANEENAYLTLGNNAFENCSSMTSITLHTTLDSDNPNPTNVFSGCTGVKTLYWGCEYYYWCSDYANFRYNGGFISKLTNLETIEINRKNEIYAHEFYGLKKLNKVTIGPRVKYVGENAFYNCTALTTVVWNVPEDKNDYASTDRSPFAICPLTSVTLGSNVTHIPAYLFSGQTKLTSVSIPSSVETIGAFAFRNVPLTQITLPSGILSIGSGAFDGCKITRLTIPEGLLSIGEQAFTSYNGPIAVTWNARRCAFSYYNRIDGWGIFYPGDNEQTINSITFGSEVEMLPARLCFNANRLTSVSLPASLQSIGDSAFYACSNLVYIESEAVVPPTLEGDRVFHSCNSSDPLGLKGITLVVPDNSLTLYKNADGWKEFFDTEEGIEEITASHPISDQAAKVFDPETGNIYILRGGKAYNLQGARVK